MQANSSLSLNKYIVKNMHFSINDDFEFNQDKTIELTPEFTRQIKKIDNNNALVNLIFRIENENLDLPFSIEVDIEGLFHMDNWEAPSSVPLMTTNSISILFPYLRSIVTMLTANANISPYILPVMNINALFDQEKESV